MLSGRLRELRGDDRGMTLMELVVGMTIMSIVGAIALNFFIGSTKQANRVTDQSLAGASARTAMGQVATVLRVADTPIFQAGYSTARFVYPSGTSLSSTEVLFYSNLTSAGRAGTGSRIPPDKVDIKLSSGTLTEKVYAPISTTYGTNYDYTQNYPSTPTSTATLLTGVTNTDVFTYCTSATDPSTKCTVATDPTTIAFVQVKLATAALAGETPQVVQSAIAITGAVS